MQKLINTIDRINAIGAGFAAGAMLLTVVLILVEVSARSLLKTSTLIADEYSGYLMVAMIMLGLGYTLGRGSHIRINFAAGRLPAGPRRLLELFVLLVAALIGAFALYHALQMVYDSWQYQMRADSLSETLLFLPQSLIPLGLLLLELQLCAEFLRRLISSPTP